MALLRTQVQRSETRFGFRVRVRSIFQESGSDIHLTVIERRHFREIVGRKLIVRYRAISNSSVTKTHRCV